MSGGLAPLRERLRELAQQLLLVADGPEAKAIPPQRRRQGRADSEEYTSEWWWEQASAIYQARRLRGSFLPASYFGEPGWDILLDLFMATMRGLQVSVTSACIGSAVATTTALRWIDVLETEALIERQPSSVDGRRTYVVLTPHGVDLIKGYLRSVSRTNPRLTPEMSLITGRGRD